MSIFSVKAQTKWLNIDSLYQPLPSSVHVYKSTDSLEGKPNVMYYAVADLKDRHLKFTTDTSYKRRLTPAQFYQKDFQPVLVVNCSFFSFATNQNLNLVVKDGKLVSYNEETIPAKGKDTLTYFHSFFGTLGISKRRNADIAWTYTDSSKRFPFASETPVHFFRDSTKQVNLNTIKGKTNSKAHFSKWEMQTAIGGGPVLLQNGKIKVTNNEERKFAGKAIKDRHPRTAIGYTKDHKIIVLVSEGRTESAAGMTLIQLAQALKNIGCVEAVNLDGGGSSCML
ncbi:MAG TPA: phosphodiester glycosidase family protein, partial [Hanamia sp.]|nr:phosphodiester glycosidase family protein [Hanamia sp.]